MSREILNEAIKSGCKTAAQLAEYINNYNTQRSGKSI